MHGNQLRAQHGPRRLYACAGCYRVSAESHGIPCSTHTSIRTHTRTAPRQPVAAGSRNTKPWSGRTASKSILTVISAMTPGASVCEPHAAVSRTDSELKWSDISGRRDPTVFALLQQHGRDVDKQLPRVARGIESHHGAAECKNIFVGSVALFEPKI